MAQLAKQNISHLHQEQCKLILKRQCLFNIRQKQFLSRFLQLPIFVYNTTDPYFYLDEANSECNDIEAALQKLKDQAELFEMDLDDFPEIAKVRRFLPLAKVSTNAA